MNLSAKHPLFNRYMRSAVYAGLPHGQSDRNALQLKLSCSAGDSCHLHITHRHCLADRCQPVQDRRLGWDSQSFGDLHWGVFGRIGHAVLGDVPSAPVVLH